MKQHLIAHVYPRTCHGTWRRTARALRQRWHLFDGRRVIAIATDETTDDPEIVKAEFGHDAEFIVGRNTPLQETATFLPCMERVIDEPGITFRCHAKGSTHGPGAASQVWADAMFAACLDFPNLVDAGFETFAILGAFRSIGVWALPGHANNPPWHFAGSMYWFRNEAARARNWRAVWPMFFGIEAWPGLFPLAESGCLFFDHAQTGHLYRLPYWRSTIAPAFALWCKTAAECCHGSAWIPPDSLLHQWGRFPGKRRERLNQWGYRIVDRIAGFASLKTA